MKHHFKLNPAAQRQRLGSGNWEEATNRQQRRLVRAYDEWSREVRKALTSAAQRGASIPEQSAILDRSLKQLEAKLSQVVSRGIEIAKNLSAGSRSDLPEVEKLARDKISESQKLVALSLIPAIVSRIIPDIARGMASDPQLLQTAFVGARTMPAQYSGGFWVMIFDTQRTLGKKRELERISQGLDIEPIRWVLDPHAEHCKDSTGFSGCLNLAKEYPNWEALLTVPAGDVTCRGNCRCHLEVYRDGVWRRGVYGN